MPAARPGQQPSTPGGPRGERIATAIDLFERDLAGRKARPDADQSPWWLPQATGLVEASRQSMKDGAIDAAWDRLQNAQRLAIHGLSDHELLVRRQVLHREVSQKLTGWRLAAANDVLGTDSTAVTAEQLIAAQQLIDENSSNVYMKLRLSRTALFVAAWLVVTVLVLLTVAVWLGVFDDISDVDDDFVLADERLLIGVMLLGMLGAELSLALDRASAAIVGSRIYELVETQHALPVARLAIGAASGIVVVAATQATLDQNDTWAILTAIPAGFSERAVRRSIEALDSRASK